MMEFINALTTSKGQEIISKSLNEALAKIYHVRYEYGPGVPLDGVPLDVEKERGFIVDVPITVDVMYRYVIENKTDMMIRMLQILEVSCINKLQEYDHICGTQKRTLFFTNPPQLEFGLKEQRYFIKVNFEVVVPVFTGVGAL